MTPSTGKEKKTASMHKILKAAKELFLTGGSQAMSVRAIAEKAGVSTIGIYSHFKGKQGILDALYIEGFQLVFDAMNIATDGQSAEQIILTGASRYLDLANTHQAHYQLIFGAEDHHYTPSSEAKKQAILAFNQLIKISAALLPQGTSLKQQQTYALEIWSIVHGYVGLMKHPVINIVDISDWKNLALAAVKTHIGEVVRPVHETKVV